MRAVLWLVVAMLFAAVTLMRFRSLGTESPRGSRRQRLALGLTGAAAVLALVLSLGAW